MTQELLWVFLAQKTIFILLFNTVAENFFKGEELAKLTCSVSSFICPNQFFSNLSSWDPSTQFYVTILTKVEIRVGHFVFAFYLFYFFKLNFI